MAPRTISLAPRNRLAPALSEGGLAGALSLAALLWRGRAEIGSAAAAVNAASQWLFPRQALREDRPSLKHTGTGLALHTVSALAWGGVYAWLRDRRLHPTPVNAATDAAAVTAAAALVDLALLPPRLSPGFDRRLSPLGTTAVFAALAAGLALGGVLALRDER